MSEARRQPMGRPRRSAARAVRVLALSLLATALAVPAAFACATCYGDPDALATQGLNHAILLLLGVVGLVYVGMIRVFLEFRRRARRLEERERRFRLIHGGVR